MPDQHPAEQFPLPPRLASEMPAPPYSPMMRPPDPEPMIRCQECGRRIQNETYVVTKGVRYCYECAEVPPLNQGG